MISKKHKIFCAVLAAALLAAIAFSYMNIPDTLVLYKGNAWEGENINFSNLDASIETVGEAIVPTKTGEYRASLSIFGIPYKAITLKVLEEKEVVLGGEAIGIRLYSDGLIVVGVGKINGDEKSPAERAGIKTGDVITRINDEKVGSPEEFSQKIAEAQGEVSLEIKRGSTVKSFEITPETSAYDGIKRVGLWVRDSTAGVGTLTYIDPEAGVYGALGHSVSDTDTGVRFEVLSGSIERCGIGGIVKGQRGSPGELQGVFYNNAEVLGDIGKNTTSGIFGKIKSFDGDRVKVGLKGEIECGKAYIRTSLDGENVEEYEIEILKVSSNAKNPSKGLTIAVTDERLLEKTGGIVQGMSGSPIIQNGKFIGAVTHVLVNDPRKGYGVLAETMLCAEE